MNRVTMWDGVYVNDAGGEMLDVAIADVSLTYGQTQPEAVMQMVEAYRTGRVLNIEQNIASIGSTNVNQLNAVYNRNYRPAQRQSALTVQANIATIGRNIPGLE